MQTDRDVIIDEEAETWLWVEGVMMVPSTGETITAEMVQQLVDEDRDRHLPLLGVDR